MSMVQYIEAKSILSKLRTQDSYFGLSYNMNLYRGCQHACIYCDTRSECYRINDISNISVKRNALELLHKELTSKKTKGTIGTGSMNDPYMPIEREQQLTRKALEIISLRKFPVHIITKGDIVVRDYDILQNISKTYAAVSFTITTADDDLSQIIEPNAPKTSERFEAQTRDRGYLTEDELKRFMAVELWRYKQRQTRDIFVFQAFTGLAYADVKKLTFDDIQKSFDGEQWLITKRKKTNTTFYVKLLPVAKQLIEQYRLVAKSKFVFPVPSNTENMNLSLRRIAKQCGITKRISSHMGRHTFFSFPMKISNLRHLLYQQVTI